MHAHNINIYQIVTQGIIVSILEKNTLALKSAVINQCTMEGASSKKTQGIRKILHLWPTLVNHFSLVSEMDGCLKLVNRLSQWFSNFYQSSWLNLFIGLYGTLSGGYGISPEGKWSPGAHPRKFLKYRCKMLSFGAI